MPEFVSTVFVLAEFSLPKKPDLNKDVAVVNNKTWDHAMK